MYLTKTVFAVFFCTSVINNVLVSGDDDEQTEPPEEKTDPPPLESHSFVALIDILFTDGNKRTCTGTIIHDNAVITAAHCFYVDVEMSGSFVVIGTKKMFDTGYENYLPIERIITHPRYRGWTANLALVFTFAGMTTDKPGNVIPLIGEGSSTPVDSNVTILSWGRCMNDGDSVTKWPADKKKRKCSSSEENNDSCERTTYKPRKLARSGSEEHHQSNSEQANSRQRSFRGDKKETAHAGRPAMKSTNKTSLHSKEAVAPKQMHKMSQGSGREDSKEPEQRRDFDATIGVGNQNLSIVSQYLRTADENKKENLTNTLRRHRKRRRHQKPNPGASTVNVKETLKPLSVKDQSTRKAQGLAHRRGGSNVSLDGDSALKSYYKNWRRKAKSDGPKENKLSIESFGFVNVQTCKKIVDKSMPREFAINPNEVVCYAAEEHYISDDDTGAPAVRQGHLVAVTVGGAQCDGDHVAIGMKMSCFCSWIVENLPAGDNIMDCCIDCCSGTKKKDNHPKDDTYYKQRHRKHAKVEEEE